MPISNFQPIRLLDLDHWYKFTYLMANNAYIHCLQWQDISGISRTRVRTFDAPVNYSQFKKNEDVLTPVISKHCLWICGTFISQLEMNSEHKNICQWEASNKYSQYIFSGKNRENIYLDTPLIWSYVVRIIKQNFIIKDNVFWIM